MVPGIVAARAETRDTKSSDAWVNVSATLLLATAETAKVSVEENWAAEREMAAAIVSAECDCVRTRTVTRGLYSGFVLDASGGGVGESVTGEEEEEGEELAGAARTRDGVCFIRIWNGDDKNTCQM